ncbi:MAG: hypothetical protein HY236_11805 [Acidobacteria bacterium]|nr:hypothetical protein [Acidobacteriota bacterium]
MGLALLLPWQWRARGNDREPRAGIAPVTVVANTSIEAHREAIAGIQAALAKSSTEVRVVDLSQRTSEQTGSNRLAAPGTRVIIAMGSDALALVAAERVAIPVICTMILRSNRAADVPALNPAATISLDVPIAALLSRLKQVFPGKTRLGIIRNPAAGGLTAAALQGRAQQEGFSALIAEAGGAEQLLPVFQGFKGRVDFVWCLPDGVLYNSATIKPLILASIKNQLPLIGFSENFARAGAAIGIYPDFRDVGLQTGEAAQQILSGGAVPVVEGPRKLKMAVNQSVLRLIGLRYSQPASGAEDFAVLP